MKSILLFEDWNSSPLYNPQSSGESKEIPVVIAIDYTRGFVRYAGILKSFEGGAHRFTPLQIELDSSIDPDMGAALKRRFDAVVGTEIGFDIGDGSRRTPLRLGERVELWLGGGLAIGERGIIQPWQN